MDRSLNSHVKDTRRFSEWVWFEGATAVLEGMGFCYNWDWATTAVPVTLSDGRRVSHVELPSILNARHFAGVAARNYAACSGGQFVEIYRPGSVCNVLLKADVVIGVGVITCEAGGTYAGYFRYAGFQGEGSAVPLQTVSAATTAAVCSAALQEGLPSGLVDVVTVTAAGGAKTCMVGGLTVIDGVALTDAHATFTMANGTISGLRKKFYCAVDLGNSYDFIVTVAGIQVDGSTTLATLVIDDIGDEDTLEWAGDWYEKGRVGCTVT